MSLTTTLIIVAAGKGERFGQPKALVNLAGEALLKRCLDTASRVKEIDKFVVVVPEGKAAAFDKQMKKWDYKMVKIVEGAAERWQSVQIGVKATRSDLVIIHNVANPLASSKDFKSIHKALQKSCAAFVGQKVVDTIRKIDTESVQTVDRKDLWRVQTPQGFYRQDLLESYDKEFIEAVSDEIMLVEKRVEVIALETSAENTKITYPEDLEQMEKQLRTDVLVGLGEDAHAFDQQSFLRLGGVNASFFPKLKGNSDGDVILHALFNALSSALGEGSIGKTADGMCEQGITDSKEYLKVVMNAVRKRGYFVNNVSVSLECARPKIDPMVPDLKEKISKITGADPGRIGITATTGEGLTPFGRGEAIQCTCLVSLCRYQ